MERSVRVREVFRVLRYERNRMASLHREFYNREPDQAIAIARSALDERLLAQHRAVSYLLVSDVREGQDLGTTCRKPVLQLPGKDLGLVVSPIFGVSRRRFDNWER